MAGRDPRADIIDENPFSSGKPKIHRVHTSQSDNGTIHINLSNNNSFFDNQKQTQKPRTDSIWYFSNIEKYNLRLAMGAFTLALGFMSVRGISGISNLGMETWAITLLLSMPVMLLAVGPAFLLHEIGHKIIAKKNGCWAEFRADPKGLQFGVILSFFLGFLFMAPGAVMVAGLVTRRQNGHIAVAGPLTNFALFLIGIPLWTIILGLSGAFELSSVPLLSDGSKAYVSGGSIIWQSMMIDAGIWWISANLILGLFNMIPWGPLDGLKVKDWNETAFYSVLLIFLIPVFGMFFGYWSPNNLLSACVSMVFG
jgi:Zn-dependent protease